MQHLPKLGLVLVTNDFKVAVRIFSFNKKWSPKLIFLDEKKNVKKDQLMFDIKK